MSASVNTSPAVRRDMPPVEASGAAALRSLHDRAAQAIRKGDAEELARALADGADPNLDRRALPDQPAVLSAPTLLSVAAVERNEEAYRVLLNAGADPCRPPDRNRLAEVVWSVSLTRLLLARGLDADARRDGANALWWYAARPEPGEAEVARALKEAGADVNSRLQTGIDDRPGQVPVICGAAWQWHADKLRLMAHLGADVRATDERGNNAVHHLMLGEPFIWEDPEHGEQGEALAPLRFGPALRCLTELGLSVDDVNHDGNTLLHLAARGCHERLVAPMFDALPDVTIRNNEGQTCIDIARESATDARNSPFLSRALARLARQTMMLSLPAEKGDLP